MWAGYAYAKAHPRWGFRRAYHDARGEGCTVNHKKVQRLWRGEGLCVPQPRRCKPAGCQYGDPVTAAANAKPPRSSPRSASYKAPRTSDEPARGSVLDLPLVIAEHSSKVCHPQQRTEPEGYRDDSPAGVQLGDAATLHLHVAVDLGEALCAKVE